MFCHKHPTVRLPETCGGGECGACYGERLERERSKPKRLRAIEPWMFKGTLAKTMR